jgi:Fic family protein
MLQFINEQWASKPPTFLSAYAMWRVNWIHPFFGGNGRTARAFSYLILCLKLGFAPPTEGTTIPELIEQDRAPYARALRSADVAWDSGRLDVSDMEELISSLLAKQLATIHFRATGRPMPDI